MLSASTMASQPKLVNSHAPRRLKILMIHTYYQQAGGEDAVFNQERKLLEESEFVEVLEFRNQPGLKGALQFLLSFWNPFAARKLKQKISEVQPDIIHLHNVHFAIGPIAIRVAQKAGVPVVMTLHNYRLLCPSATLLYDGDLFTNSLHAAFPWQAIRKKVYRNSHFQTFWLAFTTWFHKKLGTWQLIDRYILLTAFSKQLFSDSSFGIDPEKMVIKPNFKINAPPDICPVKRGRHFLFVGRLSTEKGIQVLLEAATLSGCELHIAGDGPLKKDVLLAAQQHTNIRLLGNLDPAGVEQAMKSCTALIFPSIWYEGMPMTILEALATGTPIIASNLGAMSAIIHHGSNGLHYKAGNAGELAEKLKEWQEMDDSRQSMYQQNAFATYLSEYTPERNKQHLIDIYKTILYAKTID
ncbi:MAG TPA: glycosyltransferase [Puia sp.]|nr:glycosyltransferase [Puia sp.]